MLTGRLMYVYYQQISNCCRPVLTYWQTYAVSGWPTTDHERHFAAFCYSRQRQSIMGFLYDWFEHLSAYELTNEYFTRQIFRTRFLSGYVLHGSFLQLLLKRGDLLTIGISQGSVATHLRCGGIFLHMGLLRLPAKELWKSVDIWGSCGKEFSVLFFWLTV